MAARKPKSSSRPANATAPRARGGRAKAEQGQTSGEAGAQMLRQEAERGWAAADRRQARKRRRDGPAPKVKPGK